MPGTDRLGADAASDKRIPLPPNEAALIARVANGDAAAFEVLYRCYFRRLWRFLERLTRRPQLVEEILNDTMFVVWRKANAYNLRSKVSTWIFAIAYRKALKALKRVDDAVDDEAVTAIGDGKCGPEDECLRQELRTLLTRAMAGLSADHRSVVELTYYQGYAYGEIAEIMGCPVDTVKTRMFYARRKLKTLLENRMEEFI